MPCPTAIEELSAYVDGSLRAEEELSLRRHLDTCASCQQRVKILLALKEIVARSAEVHPIPHTLREAVSSHPHASSWSLLRSSRIVQAMFVIALIIVACWLWGQKGGTGHDELAHVLVADHIHYLQAPDALEIPSTDPAEVAAWLQARVSFPVRIPHPNNIRLLGGRLCSPLGRQAALVFYEHGGKRLSLFMLAAQAIPPGEKDEIQVVRQNNPRCARTFGKYALCLMGSEDVVVAVVAEAPEIEDLALSLFRSFEEGAV